MNFTTAIPITEAIPEIKHYDKVVMLGSCFSDSIGAQFEYYKFQVLSNPFGTIFNSYSLLRLIERAVKKEYFNQSDLFQWNQMFHSFEVHSECSGSVAMDMVIHLNKKLNLLRNFLEEASHVFITLGTSWVYSYKTDNKIVANCHRVPNQYFDKILLTTAEIQQHLETIQNLIRQVNPRASIVFTISPVRHIKDGMVENQVSKSHLIAAVYFFVQQNQSAFYFPSYEILIDELRDYRFYAEDMIHPSRQAIAYIWEVLVKNYVAKDAWGLMKEIDSIQKSLCHRPLHEDSDEFKMFKSKLNERITSLMIKCPYITF